MNVQGGMNYTSIVSVSLESVQKEEMFDPLFVVDFSRAGGKHAC